jgi:hypothetical protein
MIPYSAIPNGKKNFFDKGWTVQNNLSFSTGDATSTLFLSLQNVNVLGIVPGDKSMRNTFRLNGSKTYGRFKADYTFSYANEKIDVTGGSYYQDRPVYWTVINAPQQADLRQYRDWRADPFASPSWYFNAYYGNPWWQIDAARNVTKNNNLIGTLNFSFQITNWLAASYRFGYSRNDQDFKGTREGINFDPYAVTDPWQAGMLPSSVKLLQPNVSDQLAYSKRISGDALLTANKNFGDFSTKLILGNSIYKRSSRLVSDQSSFLVIPGIYNINYRQGEPVANENFVSEGLIGVFADLTLGYKNFLFLHGTGRNDWNSKLSVAKVHLLSKCRSFICIHRCDPWSERQQGTQLW